MTVQCLCSPKIPNSRGMWQLGSPHHCHCQKNKFASRNLVHIDSNICFLFGGPFFSGTFPALLKTPTNYFRCQWHCEPGKWDETAHLCALYCSIWFQHGKDVQPKIERDIIPPAAARWYEGRGSYSSRPSCGLVLQRGCVAWRRFQLFSLSVAEWQLPKRAWGENMLIIHG